MHDSLPYRVSLCWRKTERVAPPPRSSNYQAHYYELPCPIPNVLFFECVCFLADPNSLMLLSFLFLHLLQARACLFTMTQRDLSNPLLLPATLHQDFSLESSRMSIVLLPTFSSFQNIFHTFRSVDRLLALPSQVPLYVVDINPHTNFWIQLNLFHNCFSHHDV